jgi:uroporphyrinogen decarboxylase
MSMTSRERWLAVMARQTPDRIPTDYWGTPETAEKLMRHFGVGTLTDALDQMHVDYLVNLAPHYAGPALPPGTDEFGIQYRDIDYGLGVYPEAFSHPLADFQSVEEIDAQYRWPTPDWWDYTGIPAQLDSRPGHAIRGGGSEPFLLYAKLRGDMQAMTDLIEQPEIVEYCLGKLFDLAYTNTVRIYEAAGGRVDFTYVAEDMGSQAGLMFSPRHIRRFLFPGMQRMIDLAHSAGVYVFHHNDGNIMRILPELVDMGIDILNPIQWRAGAQPASGSRPAAGAHTGAPLPGNDDVGAAHALRVHVGERGRPDTGAQPTAGAGMDRAVLKQRFGSRLIFHGAVDNQYTLPFGSVEEVRQEVRDNLAILGAGGGYILAPCHNIQSLTPIENIVAMYDTAYREG